MGRSMGLMIKGGGIFCAIIGKMLGTRNPKKTELPLSFMAAEPVVLRVHGFGFALDDGVISNPNCGGVITLDGVFELRPTHLDKVLTKLDYVFGANEEASNSASVEEGITNLIILTTVRTGPFMVGTGVSSESMMLAPARLRDLLTLR